MVEQYMTVPEVADLLKLSEKTVYRLAQNKKLPAFKVGTSWRFFRPAIDAWAKDQIRANRGNKPTR
tara:strand:- start:18595 stop:18792 length:198 start_codon:yes stop_codon:yes gene_type:complete